VSLKPFAERSEAMFDYDVVVVGAGPAGAMTAYDLARAGMNVAMLEKETLPRYKTCGGGITGRAARLLPVDISDVVERQCREAELNMGPEKLRFKAKRAQPIVSMTMRDRFDFLLIQAAQNAGADVKSECRVTGISSGLEGASLTTNKGTLHTSFVIAADGALGTVAKYAGWAETRRFIPALEYEVPASDGQMERFKETARFDFGPVRGGYAWIFPKKNHLSIGAGSLLRGAGRLKKALEHYIGLQGLDGTSGIKRHGFIIPVHPRQDTFVRRRVILTGDAAGFADPLSGEGIANALLSGRLAAQSLIKGAFDEGIIRRLYEEKVKSALLGELKMGRILSRIVYTHPRIRDCLFSLYGQRFTETVTDIFMGEKTYTSELSSISNYAQLLRLREKRPRFS
jgi:geranylgeranyl reductase family protein